ncbi:MAG: ribonuclease E/G [Clostridiales bacterium]|nr:ribonuclease E/G [Clostridiales bacterium]
MATKILITKMNIHGQDYLFSGLLEQDLLAEVRLKRLPSAAGGGTEEPALDNIYVGKVQNVVKNLNAAFVEVAPGMACYLPLEHVSDPVYVRRNSVKKHPVQGDELLVQVQREAVKTKAPMLSTNLNLTGRYVVLTSENKKIGISSRLDRRIRTHYRELIEHSLCDRYGVIVRTNAKNAADDAVISEMQSLQRRMDDIISHAVNRTCYSCLYRALPGYLSFLQNTRAEELDEIVTDLPDIYEALSAYCDDREDLAQIPRRLYEDDTYSLSALYNLKKQMERAFCKTVFLRSGGSIVIEPTEAMTVIDVNTGKSNSGKDPQKHFKQVNMEAAREIAHQIRLRNLSGIIIVDFIDLVKQEDQEELLGFLRKQVQSDPIPVQVHDITRLNLVEMTRKKVERSLAEQVA